VSRPKGKKLRMPKVAQKSIRFSVMVRDRIGVEIRVGFCLVSAFCTFGLLNFRPFDSDPAWSEERRLLRAVVYRVCQKRDTLVNYVNIMSYKLQNTRYLHSLNSFNIHYY